MRSSSSKPKRASANTNKNTGRQKAAKTGVAAKAKPAVAPPRRAG